MGRLICLKRKVRRQSLRGNNGAGVSGGTNRRDFNDYVSAYVWDTQRLNICQKNSCHIRQNNDVDIQNSQYQVPAKRICVIQSHALSRISIVRMSIRFSNTSVRFIRLFSETISSLRKERRKKSRTEDRTNETGNERTKAKKTERKRQKENTDKGENKDR